MRKTMASATLEKLGGLCENCQDMASVKTALAGMGYSQPPAPVSTDNTAEKIIVNVTVKQKISKAIDMIFCSVRDIIRKNDFHIF